MLRFHEPREEVDWAYFQGGPPGEPRPLVFLHGTSGTAGAFFFQVRALARKGYRVLSVQYPAYGSPEEWCKGFDLFLDALKCKSVHILGAGLGGFLAQHYAARYAHRVSSLALCNSFATTHAFAARAGVLTNAVQIVPSPLLSPLLRQMVLDAFPQGGGMDLPAKQAVDWMAQQVNDLCGSDLASRILLNCTPSSAGALSLDAARMTLLESSGETMVPEELRLQLRGLYPGARLAQLKASGDFPFLSRPDEVTLFLEVHMRSAGVFADNGPALIAPSMPLAGDGIDAGLVGLHAGWGADHRSARSEQPPRRPAWKNPFEDDPLL